MSPASFRSCCSVRGRSRSNSVQRELTVPIGPLLRTEMRSWSRNRCGNSPTRTAEKATANATKTEGKKAEEAPAAEKKEGEEKKAEEAPAAEKKEGEEKKEASKAAATSSLLDYLPETPLRTPQEFGKTPVRRLADDFQTPVGDTPESRAESRKKHVLAKVAQEHESVRKQHFVFGQKGSTPLRTPLRKKLCKAAFDSADPEFCNAQNSGEAQKTVEGKDSEESVK